MAKINIYDIISETRRDKKLLYKFLKKIHTDLEDEDIVEGFEPLLLDGLDKVNSQIEENYKTEADIVTRYNGLHPIKFIALNVPVYKDWKEHKVELESEILFEGQPVKVSECIITWNTVLIDPILIRSIIYQYFN